MRAAVCGARGLTDRQWIEYGEFLGRLHEVTPSAELAAVLPVETYRSTAGERLRTLGEQAAASDALGAFWSGTAARCTGWRTRWTSLRPA